MGQTLAEKIIWIKRSLPDDNEHGDNDWLSILVTVSGVVGGIFVGEQPDDRLVLGMVVGQDAGQSLTPTVGWESWLRKKRQAFM